MLGLTLEWERCRDGVQLVTWTDDEWRDEFEKKMRRYGYRRWLYGEDDAGRIKDVLKEAPSHILESAREFTREWALERDILEDSASYRGMIANAAGRLWARETWKKEEDTPEEFIQRARELDGPHHRDIPSQRYTPRSSRFVPIQYDLSDLQDPVILHFVNTTSPEDWEGFLSRFGLIHHPTKTTLLKDIEDSHAVIKSLVRKAGGHDQMTAIEAVNAALSDSFLLMPIGSRRRTALVAALDSPPNSTKPRLTLQPRSLMAFMLMEAAIVAANGAVLASCEHCGKFFLTGPLTGRRSHAKYCSDKCRVAAMRKRNAENALRER